MTQALPDVKCVARVPRWEGALMPRSHGIVCPRPPSLPHVWHECWTPPTGPPGCSAASTGMRSPRACGRRPWLRSPRKMPPMPRQGSRRRPWECRSRFSLCRACTWGRSSSSSHSHSPRNLPSPRRMCVALRRRRRPSLCRQTLPILPLSPRLL